MNENKNSNIISETQMLKDLYAAINRDQIVEAIQFFDPQIERIEPAGFPSAGTYRGHAEVQSHLSKGRSTWAEGACEPERFIAAGNKIVVFLHVKVRLKNKTDWIEGRFADGFIFENGKIVQMRTFAESQQALDWAGISQ